MATGIHGSEASVEEQNKPFLTDVLLDFPGMHQVSEQDIHQHTTRDDTFARMVLSERFAW